MSKHYYFHELGDKYFDDYDECRDDLFNSVNGLILADWIEENYSKNVSLDDVSRILNISPYYFSKLFKEDTGEGFVEYVTRIRIDKAKELLSESEYSMKEICSMVGYSDPNYFSRIFRKTVGISPTEYKGSQS